MNRKEGNKFSNRGMEPVFEKKSVWVTDHAKTRFIERVLEPNKLLHDRRFETRSCVFRFLKGLVRIAIFLEKEDRKDQYFIRWPYSDDSIYGLTLVIDREKDTLITCWPVYKSGKNVFSCRGAAE
jgi:hypothetical protein